MVIILMMMTMTMIMMLIMIIMITTMMIIKNINTREAAGRDGRRGLQRDQAHRRRRAIRRRSRGPDFKQNYKFTIGVMLIFSESFQF